MMVKNSKNNRSNNTMKPKQLFRTAILVSALGFQACFAQSISQSQLYNYVRTTWNVTSLSDDALQALLEQAPSDITYDGIPYENLIGAMIEAPRIYDALSTGDYQAAGQIALSYGQDAPFDATIEQLGLDSIAFPAEAAAWPIEFGITSFANSVKQDAFKRQCRLYFAARTEYSTYDAFLSAVADGYVYADPSIVQQGLLAVTDDGWLYTSQGAYAPNTVPGFTASQFYQFAETLYQAESYKSSFSADQSNLRQAFLNDAYPQAPVIYQQPRGGSYSQGGSLLLTVEASGQKPLQYQWFCSGSAISGANNNT